MRSILVVAKRLRVKNTFNAYSNEKPSFSFKQDSQYCDSTSGYNSATEIKLQLLSHKCDKSHQVNLTISNSESPKSPSDLLPLADDCGMIISKANYIQYSSL